MNDLWIVSTDRKLINVAYIEHFFVNTLLGYVGLFAQMANGQTMQLGYTACVPEAKLRDVSDADRESAERARDLVVAWLGTAKRPSVLDLREVWREHGFGIKKSSEGPT